MSSLLRPCCHPRHSLSHLLRFAAMGLLATVTFSAHASGNQQVLTADDVARIAQQASQANPREQVFRYTELIHAMAEQAGHEIADGNTGEAASTLKQIDHYAHLIHLALARDTRRLEASQELMHNTTYRLAEVLHLVSGGDRAAVQDTLKQLDQLNEELLAQVFAH